MPLRERFIEDNPHLIFDIGSDFPTRCLDFVEHAHTDGYTRFRCRLRPQVFDDVDAGEEHALTGPREMRKQAMLERVVLRSVRWIVRHTNLPARLWRDLCESRFAQIGARAVAPTPSTQEQQRGRRRLQGSPVRRPPLAEAVTGKCTRVRARPQGDIALLLLHLVEPMRDDHSLGKAREVMIQSL